MEKAAMATNAHTKVSQCNALADPTIQTLGLNRGISDMIKAAVAVTA